MTSCINDLDRYLLFTADTRTDSNPAGTNAHNRRPAKVCREVHGHREHR